MDGSAGGPGATVKGDDEGARYTKRLKLRQLNAAPSLQGRSRL